MRGYLLPLIFYFEVLRKRRGKLLQMEENQ
jgi:hypothetical protein